MEICRRTEKSRHPEIRGVQIQSEKCKGPASNGSNKHFFREGDCVQSRQEKFAEEFAEEGQNEKEE